MMYYNLGLGHNGFFLSINCILISYLIAKFPLTSEIRGILAPIFLVLYPPPIKCELYYKAFYKINLGGGMNRSTFCEIKYMKGYVCI